MEEIVTTKRRMDRLKAEAPRWNKAVAGLLVMSSICNAGLYSLLGREQAKAADLQEQVLQAESIRDMAVRELGAVSLASAREKQARREQAEACEAIGAWEYVGTCTVTAYCACDECCGEYADGLTATGLPVREGIVAVDPDVIPLGSTIIMDGVKYLAADTGVTGNHIDIYMPHHKMASAFGKHWQDVWVVQP